MDTNMARHERKNTSISILRMVVVPAFALFTLGGCIGDPEAGKQSEHVSKDTATPVAPDTSSLSQRPETLFDDFDTTMMLFPDTNYKTSLHINGLLPGDEYNDSLRNGSLTLYIEKPGKREILSVDSLHCAAARVSFDDYNGDGAKDLLVFYSSSARSNWSYHLFLVKRDRKELIRVYGFEDLTNTSIDSANNIITSIALTGRTNYSFYNINAKGKLINLGHSFDEDSDDSLQLEKALKKIYTEHKGTVKAR